MPLIVFETPFNFTPDADRRITVAYPAGKPYNVTRECATKATAQGVKYRLAPKEGDEFGNLSEDEGNGQAEGQGFENAEDGPETDDGSGEGEREGA